MVRETYLVDENGVIRYRHSGLLDKETWQTVFCQKLKHWRINEKPIRYFYSSSKNICFCNRTFIRIFPVYSSGNGGYLSIQNQDDRTRAVELAKSLRYPQCQNQNLVESNSQLLMTCVLKCTKWWMRAKAISKLSIKWRLDLVILWITNRHSNGIQRCYGYCQSPFLILAAVLLYFSNRKNSFQKSGCTTTREWWNNFPSLNRRSPANKGGPSKLSKGKVTSRNLFCAFYFTHRYSSYLLFSLDRFSRVQQGESNRWLSNIIKMLKWMMNTKWKCDWEAPK